MPHPRSRQTVWRRLLRRNQKSLEKIWNAFDPSIKFSGYIIGKYSIDNQEGKASNSTFDLRFVRLSASGYCFNDFYYRLQVEINGMPSKDNGPRIMDAFVEWQKFDFLRVKLGQFKRPIGFENPMSPLDVGLGNYSQATLKLASINDRIDGHKCSGRDVGVQLQGDLFPATDGHNWLHYQVGVFNGQGINHTDKDNFKDIIGGLWLSPVKGLSVGGFGWNGKYTNDDYKGDGTDLKSVERKRWGVGYMYDNGAWSTRGEYIASKGKNPADIHSANRSDAWYVQVGAPLFKDFKLFGRYDCYRENKHWNSLKPSMRSQLTTILANTSSSKPTTRLQTTVAQPSDAITALSTCRWRRVSDPPRIAGNRKHISNQQLINKAL